MAAAITLIAEGRILKAAEAEKQGIIDRVAEGDLLAQAIGTAETMEKRRVRELSVPEGDEAEEEAAAAAAIARAKGVPAVTEVIPIIRTARNPSFSDGLATERAAFLQLRESAEAKSLRHLFLSEREVWKVPGLQGTSARAVAKVAVIGAGVPTPSAISNRANRFACSSSSP